MKKLIHLAVICAACFAGAFAVGSSRASAARGNGEETSVTCNGQVCPLHTFCCQGCGGARFCAPECAPCD